MPAEVERWVGQSMRSEEAQEEDLLYTCRTSCKLEHVVWNESTENPCFVWAGLVEHPSFGVAVHLEDRKRDISFMKAETRWFRVDVRRLFSSN